MLLLGVGVSAWLGFERFWRAFHHVLFPEGGWTFDDGSALLRIYPVSYFEGFVLRWTVVVVAMSVPLVIVALLSSPSGNAAAG